MKILFIGLFVLMSCSSHQVKDYSQNEPKLNLEKFFNGDLKALGIVQKSSGKVIKRFEVDIDASWKNNIATLDESFRYSDGSKSKRVWKLKKLGKDKFQGEAGDVIGTARGEVQGNTFYFEYVLDVPVGDSSYHIVFEDWMYLLDEKTLMARSYMTKWGINVGEVTLVMIKQD